ncbi:MAG: WecB/TagA/CpsF family glycosyltransferase [Candidatus Riflebacteria bacterium]|nr:WecB/TagA/CpsF family glycosyltransferase [Candidatus Riflebacteria bacterium]
MISFTTVLLTLLLSFTGLILGGFFAIIVFRRKDQEEQPENVQRVISGFLPVIGAFFGAMATPGIQITRETITVGCLFVGFSFLGYLKDRWKTKLIIVLPYSILLSMTGVFFGLRISAGNHFSEIIISTLWPIIVIACAKLASIVDEMPFLLFMETGLVFLLFFPSQISTPEWAIIFTLCLIVTSAVFFAVFLSSERRKKPGDSIIFPIAYLLAAISIMGRSKTLLFFGLLIPSMVTVYPVLLICMLIMSSYLGNELYCNDPRSRTSQYTWSLKRERLVVFTGFIFLLLNFGLLLGCNIPGWQVFAALSVIFTAMLIAFLRTFGNRQSESKIPEKEKVEIMGVAIDRVSREDVLQKIDTAIAYNRASEKIFFHIVTADSLAIMRSRKERKFLEVLQRASLVIPDGAGLIWAADFLGTPLIGRIPGVALIEEICSMAEKKKYSVFFLGASPGRAEKASEILKAKFPELIISGTHHGYFSEGSETEESVLRKLSDHKPDVLFVALGVPRQEYFISRLRMIIDKVVVIGVGGSLDVISGALPRAPVFMQKFALEWLFRLYKEPKRFKRMMAIPKFVMSVIREKIYQN